jgi:hypothetical protein
LKNFVGAIPVVAPKFEKKITNHRRATLVVAQNTRHKAGRHKACLDTKNYFIVIMWICGRSREHQKLNQRRQNNANKKNTDRAEDNFTADYFDPDELCRVAGNDQHRKTDR